MAALIQALVISGSRLSTGEPNDTGVVYAYQPGTTSPAILYADPDAATVITQPIVLDNGGRIPYDTYPDGVWITAPIRLLVQDVTGQTVTDSTYWTSDARTDALVNDGWTGDTVDEALTAIFASVGGVDGQYQESGGATARPIQDKFREEGISVTDFGAVGNGIAIDTTAIQTTLNRIKALGGGVVTLPPGTFIIDQGLTLSTANGVTIRGAGDGITTIKQTNAAANCFTFTTCLNLRIEDLNIAHATTTTGKAIAMTGCGTPVISRVGVELLTALSTYAYGVHATNCSSATLRDCFMSASTTGLYMTDCTDARVFGGNIEGDTYGMQFAASSYASAYGTTITGVTSPLRFDSGLTGVNFTFAGCRFAVQTLSVATATIPIIRLVGGNLTGSATSSAVGNTQTPSLIDGNEVKLTAASGGAGTVTVASPAVLPPATSSATDLFWDFIFKNGSGGAVTWTLNAVFVVTAAIPATDAHTIAVRFWWDRVSSKLREVSRADTVT